MVLRGFWGLSNLTTRLVFSFHAIHSMVQCAPSSSMDDDGQSYEAKRQAIVLPIRAP